MIKRLSLGGSLMTQPDPEEVGGENCTVLENAEFDKAGIVYKRKGRGSATTTNVLLHELIRWYEGQTGTYYWVGSDAIGGDVKTSTNLTSWTTQINSSSVAYSIHNFGDAVRFSTNSLSKKAHILKYISRDVFWSAETISANLYGSETRMTDLIESIGHSAMFVSTGTGWFNDGSAWYPSNTKIDLSGGADGTSYTDYYYKYSIVFDGNQETELFGALGDTTGLGSSATSIVRGELTLDVGASLEYWNKRVTGLNVYKSTQWNGSYAKILAISCLSNDLSVDSGTRVYQLESGAYQNRGGYIPNGLLTQADAETGRTPAVNDWISYKVMGSYGGLTGDGNGIHIIGESIETLDENAPGLAGETVASPPSRIYNKTDSDTVGVWTDDTYSYTLNSIVSDDVVQFKSLMRDGSSFGVFKGDAVGETAMWGKPHWILRSTNTSTASNGRLFMADTSFPVVGGGTESDTWTYSNWTLGTYGASGTLSYSHSVVGGDDCFDAENTDSSSVSYRIDVTSPKIDLTGANDRNCIMQIRSAFINNSTQTDRELTLFYSLTSATSGFKVLTRYQLIDSPSDSTSREHHYYIYIPSTSYLWLRWSTATTPEGFDTLGATSTARIRFDSLTKVYNCCQVVKRVNEIYHGPNVFVANDFALGNNSHLGGVYTRGTSLQTDERGWIKRNVGKAVESIAVDNAETSENRHTVKLSRNHYLWLKSGGQQKLMWFDKNQPQTSYHPFGDTSTMVNYKHLKYLNGRNFVADVRIESGGESEDHFNWVMFSELNQPDVIPITNYIQMIDNQGGKIMGMESLLDDLVVFMEHGVFRLSIPSSDPTAWSLSEAEPNIGCIASGSITSVDGAVFFASKEHLYRVDPNFNITPVTELIKDVYQSLNTSATKTFYNPKKQQLFCKFGTDASVYVLDLKRPDITRWSKFITSSDALDLFVLDENSDVWSYAQGSPYKIRKHDNTAHETTSFKRTTGWIPVSNLDKSGFLRGINLRINSGGEDVTIKVYTDGDSSTARKWRSGNTSYSNPINGIKALKPGIRCKQFMIEISCSLHDAELELKSLEVEFE